MDSREGDCNLSASTPFLKLQFYYLDLLKVLTPLTNLFLRTINNLLQPQRWNKKNR